MPPRINPLKLNPLQLRTLTLLQAMARIPGAASLGANGEAAIRSFPQAHGDHFHLGDAVVAGKDATGLYNEAVWNALARKGLARADYPRELVLTGEGLGYDTGDARTILRAGGGALENRTFRRGAYRSVSSAWRHLGPLPLAALRAARPGMTDESDFLQLRLAATNGMAGRAIRSSSASPAARRTAPRLLSSRRRRRARPDRR